MAALNQNQYIGFTGVLSALALYLVPPTILLWAPVIGIGVLLPLAWIKHVFEFSIWDDEDGMFAKKSIELFLFSIASAGLWYYSAPMLALSTFQASAFLSTSFLLSVLAIAVSVVCVIYLTKIPAIRNAFAASDYDESVLIPPLALLAVLQAANLYFQIALLTQAAAFGLLFFSAGALSFALHHLIKGEHGLIGADECAQTDLDLRDSAHTLQWSPAILLSNTLKSEPSCPVSQPKPPLYPEHTQSAIMKP